VVTSHFIATLLTQVDTEAESDLRYLDSEPGITVPMPVRRTSPQTMTGTVEVSGTHKFAPSDAVHWSHLRARPHADPVSARTRKD
jgi:hypothetical protein